MKVLSLFFIATLFVVVIGCDGDGGDGTTTTETITEETETVVETKTPVTIASGSETVPAWITSFVCLFDVFETGMIEATVEWSSPPGPSKLNVTLYHDGGTSEYAPGAQSPATLMMQATQDLLNISSRWKLEVDNPDFVDADVNYTVRLTPD